MWDKAIEVFLPKLISSHLIPETQRRARVLKE